MLHYVLTGIFVQRSWLCILFAHINIALKNLSNMKKMFATCLE